MSEAETVLVMFVFFCGVIPFALILIKSVFDLCMFGRETKKRTCDYIQAELERQTQSGNDSSQEGTE